MNKQKQIDELRRRIEVLERSNQSPQDTSIEQQNIESVKQQVIELLHENGDVTDWLDYVAVDKDGAVWEYQIKPTTKKWSDEFTNNNGDTLYVGSVDTDGSGWSECCWKTEDLFEDLLEDRPKDTNSQEGNWENLLSEDVIADIFNIYPHPHEETKNLNRVINELIKPVLEENKRLQERHENDMINSDNLYHSLLEYQQAEERQIEVPFELDKYGDVYFATPDTCMFFRQLKEMNVNQNNIKKIIVEMKED